MSEVEVVRLVFVWHEEQEAAINKLDKNKSKIFSGQYITKLKDLKRQTLQQV